MGSSDRPAISLLQALTAAPRVADGAMGTALFDRGFPFERCYEELTISRPDVVLSVHAGYVDAGAEILETNTFGANRVRLGHHGLDMHVLELNRSAVHLARAAARDRGHVVGAMGPTGLVDFTGTTATAARDAFQEQAAALFAGGVDGIALETMQHPGEIALAVSAVRDVAPGVPLLVMVAIDERLAAVEGTPLDVLGARIRDLGADALGINCGPGPDVALAGLSHLRSLGLPLVAMPSAGLPKKVGDRWEYDSPPARFADFARKALDLGARLVGGCCGTRVAHVRAMADVVRGAAAVVRLSAMRTDEVTYDRARLWEESLIVRARAIVDPALRAGWVRSEIVREALPEAARALDLLCLDAEQARPDAREVLVSVVHALIDPASEDLVQHLREEAAGESLLALGRLLRRPRPAIRPAPSPTEPPIPDYGTGRPLTLGERKALARKPDRRSFDRLLRDPDPTVIRNLLGNPKLTEDDVLALVVKRPARADVIVEIARSVKWSMRSRIRMAIVLNPGSPPEVAVPLVGLLLRAELRLVTEVTDAQPLVRAAARELLMRRPPALGGESDEDGELQ
jgi:methionine synthase I (cobalamin-dependent)